MTSIYTTTPKSADEFAGMIEEAIEDYPKAEAAIRAIAQQMEAGQEAAAWRKIIEEIDDCRRSECQECQASGFITYWDENWPCSHCAPFAE